MPKWNNNDLKGKYWIQLHDIFSMLTEYPCISMFLSFYIVFKHPCFDEEKTPSLFYGKNVWIVHYKNDAYYKVKY